MSPAEWQSRVELAAVYRLVAHVYRLVAHHGWDDVITTTAPCAFQAKTGNS